MFTKLSIMWFVLVAFAGASHAQTCTTPANPAANVPLPYPHTSAAAFAAIDAARAVEKLAPLEATLPVNYPNVPPDQQLIMLINTERLTRGLTQLNTTSNDNDPALGYNMANHVALVAALPIWWNDTNTDLTPVVHDDAIDGSVNDRIIGIPTIAPASGTQLLNAGEILAVDSSPEAALYAWMYNDGPGWGHRTNILHCTFTNAGAGVATNTATTATYGSGTSVYGVDFIYAVAGTYKMVPLPYVAPVAGQTTEYIPPVGQKLLNYIATLDAANNVTINFTANYDPVYGVANAVKWIYIWSPANWGQPFGALPALGEYPAGTGAVPCTPVIQPPDPLAVDQAAITYSCSITTQFYGNPIEIDAVDSFSNTLRIHANVNPPM